MLSQNLSGDLIRDPCPVTDEHLIAIQSLPNPPLVDLKKEELIVRRCRLASDQIDSRFGRFRSDDLPRLLELVNGAPVLIGHDRRTLGVARFFGGEVQKRGDSTWILPLFYWHKEHSQAEDLRVMIDSGVYSEASIAFLYQKPTCSICGNDLRQCSHWPGRKYDGKLAFYWYDEIERVTEGSLVYRGAAPGTGFELPCEHSKSCSTKNATSDPENLQIRVKHRGKHYSGQLERSKPHKTTNTPK
ncbi:hypothetical protein K8I28_16015 [bacterium]|nr:hypothetical protein [bacterium]